MNARTLALLGAITMTGAVVAQDELPPRQFHLTVPLVAAGRPVAAIVAPANDDYQALAARVRAAVREASGAELPIIAPEEALPEAWTEGRSFILLGRLGDSAAVDALYLGAYVCADALYPGAGGYELRTVHDPYGTGASGVFLGGSDHAGVERAVERFAEVLPAGADLALPPTIDVAGPAAPAPLSDAGLEDLRERLARENFRAVGERASSGCLNYHRSGDPNHALAARDALYRLAEIVAEMDVIGDSRGVIYLPTVFDLAEECPAWSDDDRAALSRFLYEFSTKLGELQKEREPSPIPYGNNWNIRTAASAAQYFAKYYGIDLNGHAARSLRTYFDAMMTWKSREDCPGYGSMTVIDIMSYTLPRREFAAYFDSGLARRMADYAMIITDNLGNLAGFGDYSALTGSAHFPDPMSVLAWYYRDGRYVWMREKMNDVASGAEFLGQSYQIAGIEPVEPTDLLGVQVLPLEEWIWAHRDIVLTTGVARTDELLRAGEDPERAACFDKLSFRAGFDPQDEYLLLGGQSHGYHSHPDGNAIISLTAQGRQWLFDNGYFVPDTIEHNTVAVFRDGLFEPVPRLTGIEARADLPTVGITRTGVRAYNGMDWARAIIWLQGDYFLVLDELSARVDGDFGLQCIFRVLGEPEMSADRVLVRAGGKRFALMTDGLPTWERRDVTPEAAGRYGLFENQDAQLQAGARLRFANLLYCPTGAEDFPYEIARSETGATLIQGPDGLTCAGMGVLDEPGLPRVDAAAYHLAPARIALAAARSLAWPRTQTIFSAEPPVALELDLAAGAGALVAETAATVRLAPEVCAGLTVDGAPARAEGGMLVAAVAPGEHALRFTARAALAGGEPATAWPQAQARKLERMRARVNGDEAAGTEVFRREFTREYTRTVFVNAEGRELENLARQGVARTWTEAQAGARPGNATDGDFETYSAVSSSAPHANVAPKDLGVEWDTPRTVAQAWFYHYSAQYQPADDGHDLQYWDGEDWVSIDDTVEKRDGDATWVHTFAPVETTRLRLFVTAFNTARTAIREMAFFAEPVEPVERTEVSPEPVHALITANLIGAEAAEVIACVGSEVVAINGGGEVLWRAPVGTGYGKCVAAYDLDGDGRIEVVVGGSDMKVHCFDADGNERWVTDCPADPYYPEIEPAPGTVDVIAAGDINADGRGEVVFGASNWFAYALDADGAVLWRSLNFAHPPLDITLADVTGDGRLEALIATRYNTANLFDADGRVIDRVSAGYHGIPMRVATGDLDGNGLVELIAGSRVGGVHVKEHGGERAWDLNLGSQVTDVAAEDLDGDGRPELLACSSNHYLLCAEADGTLRWRRNLGGAARQMAVGDLNGDGAPEIVVAVAGQAPAVIGADGALLGRLGPADAELVTLADVNGDGGLEPVAARTGLVAAYRRP